MNRPVNIPPKVRISKSFGLKAATYEKYAEVQRKFQNILISRILQEKSEGIWIDLGCGTGLLFETLFNRGWNTTSVGVDLSIESLRYLSSKPGNRVITMLSDIDHLPFKKDTIQGAVFSSVLQWINDMNAFFSKLAGTLRHNGTIFFSIFTADSFKELSEARKRLDISNPIFLPSHDQIETTLRGNGFKEISLYQYEEIVYFSTARDLLRSLSAIGSTAVSQKPMTRSRLNAFCSILESTFKTDCGIPLTYRATIGWARKE